VPRQAIAFAILAFLLAEAVLVYLVSRSGLPIPFFFEASLVLLIGLSAAGYVLLAGFVYRDAQRRGMRAAGWALVTLVIPGAVGFIFYFIARKPLLGRCPACHSRLTSARCQACGYRV
jgi:hypothetical protein